MYTCILYAACAGQSNMWLPMHFDTSRNATYDAVLAGKYQNIRMHTFPMVPPAQYILHAI